MSKISMELSGTLQNIFLRFFVLVKYSAGASTDYLLKLKNIFVSLDLTFGLELCCTIEKTCIQRFLSMPPKAISCPATDLLSTPKASALC
mmetsp:Transcript_3710/g.5012  ORF Transcript_3710/g.5012 Transcript_3710/m.5012 type:complete len:90 (+) Transcript_3710:567-836(+)